MDLKVTLNNGAADTVLDDYILDNGIGQLSIRVESDKPGEPGVVMFDSVNMEFKESDLGSLFTTATLAAIKAAGTDYTVTLKVNFGSSDRTMFIGLVDFDSVEYTQDGTVKFNVMDRLSKIKLAPKSLVRSTDNYMATGYKFRVRNDIYGDNVVVVGKYNIATGFYANMTTAEFPAAGDVYNYDGSYYLVTKVEVLGISWDGQSAKDGLKVTFHNDWIETSDDVWDTIIAWYDKEIYGNDRLNYSSGVPVSYDAYAILTDILYDVYGSYTADTTNLGTTSFPADLDHFYGMGIGDHEYNLFSDHPQDALKRIIRNMRIYMYWHTDGKLYFVDWPNTAPSADVILSTSTSAIIQWHKKFNWEKRVDMVHVEADYTEGSDYADYPNLYSDNNAETMNVTVFKPYDSSLSALAEDLWEFYGKRHLAASVTLALDDTLAQALSVLTCVSLDSIDYFVYGYTIDFQAETVELEMASYTRWEH